MFMLQYLICLTYLTHSRCPAHSVGGNTSSSAPSGNATDEATQELLWRGMGPIDSWFTGKIGGAKPNPYSPAIWMDSGLVICVICVFGCSAVGRWRADVLVYNYLCTEQCGTTKSVLECFSQLGAGWVWVGGRNPSLQEMAERLCDAGRLCTLLCGCPHRRATWRWGHV